jgi:uncharacterized iron-regulated protein
MVLRAWCLAFVVAWGAACGGSYGGTAPRAGKAGKAGKPARGIEAAALPYSVLDARTGRQIETEAFWTQLAGARVACVGEDHPNPHHHWFQLEAVTQLVARRPGAPFALGMEMFQRPFQGVLDDFAANRIDEAALLSRSGWEERWGYDFGFYRPTMHKAIAAGGKLLALNAPRELVKRVVRVGVEGLAPDEQRQLPELDLDSQAHRAWFEATMEELGGAHGHGSKSAPDDAAHANVPNGDRIYAAQVLWDETMADGAATWAKQHPGGLLVLLAGNGHCHDSAIIARVRRRGVDKVVSVRPVLDVEGRVAAALARPVTDYLVVLELPADVKAELARERDAN